MAEDPDGAAGESLAVGGVELNTGIPTAAETVRDQSQARLASKSLQWRRIRLNLVIVGAANILALVTGPILARALGPAARGVLAAALLWPQLVSLIFSLGVTDSVTYFASRAEVGPREVRGNAAALAAVQTVSSWVIGIPIVYLTMNHLGSSAVVSALLYLAAMPAQVYSIYLAYLLNGLHRYGWFNVIQLLPFLATAAGYAVLFAGGSLTVRTAVLATDASIVLTLLLAWVVVRATLRGEPSKPEPGLWRRLLAFGLRSWLSNVPHLLNDRVDQLVISVALPAHSLGLYAIAATIATAPSFVGVGISNSALPTVASLHSVAEQLHAIRRCLLLTLGMTLLAAVIVVVAMHPVISLVFGRAFLGAASSARVLSLAVVLQALTRVFHGVLKGLGRPTDAAISEAGALIVTGIGLAVLIPPLGIMGAALTSLAAYSTSTLIAARFASVAIGVRPHNLIWRAPTATAHR